MTPGSPAARLIGCMCDPAKNADGLGSLIGHVDPLRGPEYVVATNCTIHGPMAWQMPQVTPRGEERTITSPITIAAR